MLNELIKNADENFAQQISYVLEQIASEAGQDLDSEIDEENEYTNEAEEDDFNFIEIINNKVEL